MLKIVMGTLLLLGFAILMPAQHLPTAAELSENCKIASHPPSTYENLPDLMEAGFCHGYIAAWLKVPPSWKYKHGGTVRH